MSALRRLRQEDCELGDILGYIVRWKGEKREGKRKGGRERGKGVIREKKSISRN